MATSISDPQGLVREMRQWAQDLQAVPLPAERIPQALGLWKGYPLWASALRNIDDPDVAYDAWSYLQAAHMEATRRLMELIEAEGIDSAQLWRSAELCRRLFGFGSWPTQLHAGLWPECAPDAGLLADERQVVTEAEAALNQLVARRNIHPPDLTPGEKDILDALRESKEPLRAREIADKAGVSPETAKQYLRPGNTLCASGLVLRTKQGYIAPP